jgi:predicted ABC-type ATPase
MPRCLIIAGPNGAGKTTFALKYLPSLGIRNFANADEIARGLSPLDVTRAQSKAGRIYLREIEDFIQAREDFAFETTLSGLGYLRLIERLKREDWEVGLYYLALHDVAVSRARVRERVQTGGHDIPDEAIARRYGKSLRNLLYRYSMKVDRCFCFMNDLPPEKREFADSWLVFTNIGEARLIGSAEFYNLIVLKAEP